MKNEQHFILRMIWKWNITVHYSSLNSRSKYRYSFWHKEKKSLVLFIEEWITVQSWTREWTVAVNYLHPKTAGVNMCYVLKIKQTKNILLIIEEWTTVHSQIRKRIITVYTRHEKVKAELEGEGGVLYFNCRKTSKVWSLVWSMEQLTHCPNYVRSLLGIRPEIPCLRTSFPPFHFVGSAHARYCICHFHFLYPESDLHNMVLLLTGGSI